MKRRDQWLVFFAVLFIGLGILSFIVAYWPEPPAGTTPGASVHTIEPPDAYIGGPR